MMRIEYPHRYTAEMVYDQIVKSALTYFSINDHDPACQPLELLANSTCPQNNSVLDGATFKSLACVAHKMGLSKDMRQEWYEVARRCGLSQAHVSTIIARLNERDAFIEEAEMMLKAS